MRNIGKVHYGDCNGIIEDLKLQLAKEQKITRDLQASLNDYECTNNKLRQMIKDYEDKVRTEPQIVTHERISECGTDCNIIIYDNVVVDKSLIKSDNPASRIVYVNEKGAMERVRNLSFRENLKGSHEPEVVHIDIPDIGYGSYIDPTTIDKGFVDRARARLSDEENYVIDCLGEAMRMADNDIAEETKDAHTISVSDGNKINGKNNNKRRR